MWAAMSSTFLSLITETATSCIFISMKGGNYHFPAERSQSAFSLHWVGENPFGDSFMWLKIIIIASWNKKNKQWSPVKVKKCMYISLFYPFLAECSLTDFLLTSLGVEHRPFLHSLQSCWWQEKPPGHETGRRLVTEIIQWKSFSCNFSPFYLHFVIFRFYLDFGFLFHCCDFVVFSTKRSKYQ